MRIVENAYAKNGVEVTLDHFVNDYYSFKLPKSKWNFEISRNSIKKLKRRFRSSIQKEIINFIADNYEEIIKASPKKLHKFAALFDSEHYTREFYFKGKQTRFGKAILDGLNYESFRKTTKASWFGNALNIKACLYCNASYAITIEKGTHYRMLYQFDHFYSKIKYPHLSLSMFNLIPCCSSCNIAKSKGDFTIKNAIHPYLEDANKAFRFVPNYSDVIKYFIRSKADRKINVDIKSSSKKFDLHNKTFSLKEIYNCHNDVVEELYLKAYYYNSTKRKEIVRILKNTVDESLINRFILGNYNLDSELNKRPLAKLTKDIARKIKLI